MHIYFSDPSVDEIVFKRVYCPGDMKKAITKGVQSNIALILKSFQKKMELKKQQGTARKHP